MKTLTTNLWIIADKISYRVPFLVLYSLLVYSTIKGLNYLLTFLNL